MVDYIHDIGGSTSMMIRDTGGNVEFWVKTGSQTWNNQQPWSFFANGSNSGTRYFRMLRGGNWQKFGEVYVQYDQDVRFTLVNSGLGFPTHDFWQHITRSTVPPPPKMIQAAAISATQIRVIFEGVGDGGSPILEWQIGYGPNSSGPIYTVASDGSTDIGGFTSGQRSYFWARGRNAIGWSGWSFGADATTWRVPGAPTPVAFRGVEQTSVLIEFGPGEWGGTPVLESQVGYGQHPTVLEHTATQTGALTPITGLDPGETYYFWSRSRNAVGWGPWSARRTLVLIAGARILVGNEWKRAVPYVKVGGVWKVVRPWVRNAGIWKETSV